MYEDALLFERALFMSANGLHDAEVIRRYATATGELSRGLSMSAVMSRGFTHRLLIEPELLLPGASAVEQGNQGGLCRTSTAEDAPDAV